MKMTVNGVLVTPVLGRVTLEKHREEAAYTLTATLWTAAADNYFLKLSLALGDVVRLFDDDGTERFVGNIQRIDRTAERVDITAFDKGIYLARNALWGIFAGTGEEICRTVARRLGIKVGSIDADEAYRTIVVRTGQNVFSILRTAAGEGREVAVEGEKLTVRRVRDGETSLEAEQILEVSSGVDIRDMVNRCEVMSYKGELLADALCAADIVRYGTFRTVELREEKDAFAQAAAALRGRRASAEVMLQGDLRLLCGGKVRVRQPQWGLSGLYRIAAVCHRWENGIFTTELTLEEAEE